MSRLLLGTTLRPVIVTDAGLHNPWLRAVAAPGWGFGGRVRGRVMLAGDADNDWEPRPLTKTRRTRADPLDCHFVLVEQPRCYRHDVKPTR